MSAPRVISAVSRLMVGGLLMDGGRKLYEEKFGNKTEPPPERPNPPTMPSLDSSNLLEQARAKFLFSPTSPTQTFLSDYFKRFNASNWPNAIPDSKSIVRTAKNIKYVTTSPTEDMVTDATDVLKQKALEAAKQIPEQPIEATKKFYDISKKATITSMHAADPQEVEQTREQANAFMIQKASEVAMTLGFSQVVSGALRFIPHPLARFASFASTGAGVLTAFEKVNQVIKANPGDSPLTQMREANEARTKKVIPEPP